MAIKETSQKEKRISTPNPITEDVGEESLRPKKLSEYIGQTMIKKHLQVALDAAKVRSAPIEHVLFYGPPGLGKTTLAMLVAAETGGSLRHTSGPAIDKPADMLSVLTSLQPGDILFIDEIHRLKPVIEEILYSAMEDYQIDIMVGSGPGATSIKMDLPKFSLIGATTRLSSLSHPLRDRFGHVWKMDLYEDEDLAKIVERSAKILGVDLGNDESLEIAKRSRGTPRIANRLTKIVRDYHILGKLSELSELFREIHIDEYGLDDIDRQLIRLLGENNGNAMGINTLAAMIGEEAATIEDVIEPFLIKIGLLERTPRGRVISMKGREYLQRL
ncbi:MAG: Holliday junction branch migration DNA helicase RuvB [bacterium]